MGVRVTTGFARAHGRRSRTNLSHTGGHEPRTTIPKDAPDGQCWGCWQNRWEPAEHSIWCPVWQDKEVHCGGA